MVEDDDGIAHHGILFRIEERRKTLGDLKVPLVADVAEVFVRNNFAVRPIDCLPKPGKRCTLLVKHRL